MAENPLYRQRKRRELHPLFYSKDIRPHHPLKLKRGRGKINPSLDEIIALSNFV